jgi:alanine racemase
MPLHSRRDHEPVLRLAGDVASSVLPLSPPADEAGATLTIDLCALAANWRLLRDRGPAAECAAVVKADAYGTGIEAAAPALWRAGCRTFFVAHLAEARRLRAVLPEAVLYVLNGMLPGAAPAFRAIAARPVLGSRPEIDDWAAFCRGEGARLPAALHADTGMNRLGLSPADAIALARDPVLADFTPALLMSHFVTAEAPEHPLNARQVAAFMAVRAALPGIPASLANSSGLFLADRIPALRSLDLARPGYALYGGNPTPGSPNPMQPVVGLKARIVQTRRIEAGDTAGYNGRWTARRPTRLATISVGYADGYLRQAGGTDAAEASGLDTGAALVGGRVCPIAGRISMDLTIIDVTDVPERDTDRGAPVTLIGDGLDVDEVGRRAGTIGYEILTDLGRRYARHYIGS